MDSGLYALISAMVLPSPGVVYEQLRIDAEKLVQQLLVVDVPRFSHRAPSHILHGVQAMGLQFLGIPGTHPPKIGQGTVAPQGLPIAHLIQFRNAHTVFVWGNVLGLNIHGHLGQVQVGADPPVAVIPTVFCTSKIMVRASSLGVRP